MRFRWPKDTEFRRLVLDVEQGSCGECGHTLRLCDHRIHRIYTLAGPVELCCRLTRCPGPSCPSRARTFSPEVEPSLALPWWLVGWDVFCWMGHRRFARHWSIPQLRAELLDTYHIRLSEDAIADYLRRYQVLVAARQQDLGRLRRAYHGVADLWLSIDGLQPEKGHETLSAVRELRAGRIWFAQALLSSNTDEVRRLLARARAWAQSLGKPVRLWVSDKQDAFVKGIRSEFPGVPPRYCVNHFLRDLAKPTLEQDSHAKVQMRKKVRGLRGIERAVLSAQQADAKAALSQGVAPEVAETAATRAAGATRPSGDAAAARPGDTAGAPVGPDDAGQVVLDYRCAVRGILNDDQGGPLHPPGLRMAQALTEVRASLGRVLALNKPGAAHGQLTRLAGYIDGGLAAVQEQQKQVEHQVEAIAAVAETLAAETGGLRQRRGSYQRLLLRYRGQGGQFYGPLAKVMQGWQAGLFVAVRGKGGQEAPQDNLALERFFRLPKGHERRRHGHQHAGVRIVQEGPTLLLALDAHQEHPEPFTAQDLLPYRHAQEPQDQLLALHRRTVMGKARSQKNGPSYSQI
jgi:hypothetical protein